MTRIGHLLEWLVDVVLPNLLLTALLGMWLVGVVVLSISGPWYAGVIGGAIGIALGLPFLAAVCWASDGLD